MQARPSPGLLVGQGPRPRAASADRATRVRFRRAVALMLMTLVLPGSAQLVAGNKRTARIAMRIWFVVVLVVVGTLLTMFVRRDVAFWVVSSPLALGLLRVALVALAVGWALLFLDAWRLGQPLSLHQRQRLAVVGLNGFLSLTVAGTLLFGAHLVAVQRDFIITTFGDGAASGAHDGRYNVLLLGGDSGAGRWGLRPDSMTIASIDASTGKTVLIGLPRNMENFPFARGSVMHRQFPQGFDCDGCYLNGVSTWAGDHTDLFRGSKNPGVDATIMAIEGITDLKINYWAMVNLQGFKDLVDAVGGVTLHVRSPIPVGGLGDDVVRHIPTGTRKLNGLDTLWYARAREGSDDYSRMARQKCVMNAMLHQISPQVALRNFSKIAKAGSAMVSTNVPRSEVDRFIGLALKAQSEKIATVSLVPPLITTADPDIGLIQSTVAEAIQRSENGSPAPTTAPKKKRKLPTTGGSFGTLSGGYAANQSDDLGSAC
jgi:polyisoprenyl-teichoic acid--peptidoglycan teichoic acid transferase